jgi:uncharacterized membrane protein
VAETPADLFVAAFTSEDGALNAFGAIASARQSQLLSVREMAVVRRDQHGKLHISEGNDMGPGGAAASGAAVGAAVGLFGGPIGALLGGAAGAAIGGLAGKLIDTGIPDGRLRELGARLTPGSSAFIALVDRGGLAALQSAFAWAGGDTLSAALSGEVAGQLAAAAQGAKDAVAAAGGTVGTVAPGAGATPR